ncbi:TPA: hypothetical protein ACSP2I_003119 [Aeromonas veronii]|uniref:hypothetical protein n=1 Tax=Aeromonas TaxID=642 RepID=UPI001BCD61C6|nr:hypothetical protein [Aeromonas allosaccharophila]MBS4694722.1 hypothetical protein [Aeromonas allosaccharophila]
MSNPDRDDIVLLVVMAFCITTPVILTSLWAFSDRYYPPMLIAALLGIAIAALTYRYLGGTAGSEFSVGVLKVAGSAALLVGTMYFTNEGLAKQIDRDNAPNRLAKAIQERDDARRQIDELKTRLEVVEAEQSEVLISKIRQLKPSSSIGRQIAEMAKSGIGPFSEVIVVRDVNVTVVGYIQGREQFHACSDLEFADKRVRFSRPGDEVGDLPQPAPGRQVGLIAESVCRGPRRFDIQLSCADGSRFFPEHITGCADSTVRWKERNGPRVFNLSAEVLAR